ncbi:lactonase family protein [Formosa sp. S-31]|uniref:lactonase family protein n=1 Tax=Formosa sp. S-31 TaxID=2790949 RepID=UPI003EB906A6
MKRLLYLICLVLISSCQSSKTSTINKGDYPFYLGTYTRNDSKSKGIYKYVLKKDGSLQQLGLKATTKNPSFLCFNSDKTSLIAANELAIDGSGAITAYDIKNDSLIFKNTISSGGTNPCFVTATPDDYIIAANYNSGTVGLLKLKTDGYLSDLLDTQKHIGKGANERQDAPHAHSVWKTPDSNSIISVDLGTNQLWFSKIDKDKNILEPVEPLLIDMAEGAGPRHLTFHPSKPYIYVLNELNNTVTRIEKVSESNYNVKESISTLPDSFTETNTSADIHISADGKFLYTTNRGHNSIAIFKVDNETGILAHIANESTRGKTPRNFSLSPKNDFLLVANQHSDNIVSFKRNKKTGLLTFIDDIEAPRPVCILFE